MPWPSRLFQIFRSLFCYLFYSILVCGYLLRTHHHEPALNISRPRLARLVALAAVPPLSHSSPLSAISRKIVSVSVEGLHDPEECNVVLCLLCHTTWLQWTSWTVSTSTTQMLHEASARNTFHSIPILHLDHYYANVGKRFSMNVSTKYNKFDSIPLV